MGGWSCRPSVSSTATAALFALLVVHSALAVTPTIASRGRIQDDRLKMVELEEEANNPALSDEQRDKVRAALSALINSDEGQEALSSAGDEAKGYAAKITQGGISGGAVPASGGMVLPPVVGSVRADAAHANSGTGEAGHTAGSNESASGHDEHGHDAHGHEHKASAEHEHDAKEEAEEEQEIAEKKQEIDDEVDEKNKVSTPGGQFENKTEKSLRRAKYGVEKTVDKAAEKVEKGVSNTIDSASHDKGEVVKEPGEVEKEEKRNEAEDKAKFAKEDKKHAEERKKEKEEDAEEMEKDLKEIEESKARAEKEEQEEVQKQKEQDEKDFESMSPDEIQKRKESRKAQADIRAKEKEAIKEKEKKKKEQEQKDKEEAAKLQKEAEEDEKKADEEEKKMKAEEEKEKAEEAQLDADKAKEKAEKEEKEAKEKEEKVEEDKKKEKEEKEAKEKEKKEKKEKEKKDKEEKEKKEKKEKEKSGEKGSPQDGDDDDDDIFGDDDKAESKNKTDEVMQPVVSSADKASAAAERLLGNAVVEARGPKIVGAHADVVAATSDNNPNSALLNYPKAGYDKKRPPPGEKVLIKFNLVIDHITTVEDWESTAGLSFTTNMIWVDARLNYEADQAELRDGEDYLVFMNEDATDLWLPPLWLHGSEDVSNQRRRALVYPNGTVLYTETNKATVVADIDTTWFPFDRSYVNVTLVVQGYNAEQVLLYESEDMTPLTSAQTSNWFLTGSILPEDIGHWTMTNYTGKAEIYKFSDGTTRSVVSSRAELWRNPLYYLVAYLIPMDFLVLFAGAAFYISPLGGGLTARMGIYFGTLFTLMAFHYMMTEDLPRAGYVMWMNVYMLGQYVCVLIPFIFHMVSSCLQKPSTLSGDAEKGKGQDHQGAMKWLFCCLPGGYSSVPARVTECVGFLLFVLFWIAFNIIMIVISLEGPDGLTKVDTQVDLNGI